MKTRMAIVDGFAGRREAFVTHNGDWDTLLVRVGHYLWRKWKETNDLVYIQAVEDIWEAKRAYRAPVLAKIKANRFQAGERIKQRVRT